MEEEVAATKPGRGLGLDESEAGVVADRHDLAAVLFATTTAAAAAAAVATTATATAAPATTTAAAPVPKVV